ncbi:MAG: riboflavin synthase [Alphaproteobacteria bacterium]|nr:riboflavin synthase [Alphaproteobacteria bacterium]
MFTGLVTAVGEVTRAERPGAQGIEQARFEIASPYDPDSIAIGASVSHAGCCLTIVSKERTNTGMRHIVECSPETLSLTTLGRWREGVRVNLERAMRVGDELGGHIVAGHVDGMGELRARGVEGDYLRLAFAAPRALMPYLAPKGSIAIDGVSLTVNTVDAETFSVMIIPHTAAEPTLGALTPGEPVNLEADLIARYVARMLAFKAE